MAEDSTQAQEAQVDNAPASADSQNATSQAPQAATQDTTSSVTNAPKPEASTQPTQEPASARISKPFKSSAPKSTQSFEERVADLKVTGSSHQKTLIAEMERYLERMAPNKPVTANEGVKHQFALWVEIRRVLESVPREEFKPLWTLLLQYFYQHRNGALGAHYVYRFAEAWPHAVRELDAFQAILDLLTMTADPNERGNVMRRIDFNKLMQRGLSDEARQRLVNFYA